MENKVKQLGKMDADQKLVLVAGLVSILSIAFIFMGTRIWEEYEKGVIGNDMLPVKRTVKKYEIFPAGSQVLLAAFYAARHNSCFSIGVITPKLRCTLMVL